jgi:hypothetical protein
MERAHPARQRWNARILRAKEQISKSTTHNMKGGTPIEKDHLY